MTDRPAEKPTEQWVTGDEPMTGPQASYLETLAREAGEEVPDELTKAQASEMIERLQADGTCWASGTTWHGMAALRVAISNWSTTEEDIDRTAAAIVRAT